MASPAKFIAETRDELSKVTWPTRSEVIRLTTIVLIISLVVGLYIGGIDLLLTKLFEAVIK